MQRVIIGGSYSYDFFKLSQICRTKLGPNHCYENTDSVKDWWPLDVNYSKSTCDLLELDAVLNCSLLDFYGINVAKSYVGTYSKPNCSPRSMRQAASELWAIDNPVKIENRINLGKVQAFVQ